MAAERRRASRLQVNARDLRPPGRSTI